MHRSASKTIAIVSANTDSRIKIPKSQSRRPLLTDVRYFSAGDVKQAANLALPHMCGAATRGKSCEGELVVFRWLVMLQQRDQVVAIKTSRVLAQRTQRQNVPRQMVRLQWLRERRAMLVQHQKDVQFHLLD